MYEIVTHVGQNRYFYNSTILLLHISIFEINFFCILGNLVKYCHRLTTLDEE